MGRRYRLLAVLREMELKVRVAALLLDSYRSIMDLSSLPTEEKEERLWEINDKVAEIIGNCMETCAREDLVAGVIEPVERRIYDLMGSQMVENRGVAYTKHFEFDGDEEQARQQIRDAIQGCYRGFFLFEISPDYAVGDYDVCLHTVSPLDYDTRKGLEEVGISL
jgi:hypothetical protein